MSKSDNRRQALALKLAGQEHQFYQFSSVPLKAKSLQKLQHLVT